MAITDLSPTADLRWYLWNPTTAAEHSEIVSAVEGFEASDTVLADQDTKTWLKSDALNAYPRVVTYVAVRDGLVEGFFALTSVQVALTMPRRPLFSRSRDRDSLQEAVLIAAMGRRHGASLSDRDILLQIIGIVLNDAQWPGAVALFTMSDNSAFTESLKQNHFQSISGSGSSRLFWFPLPNTPDA
jgi:hypothetical protein